MTTTSSYFENINREGAAVWNGKVTLSTTTLTLQPYSVASFSTASPLLVRYRNLVTQAVTTGTKTFDFAACSWGLPADDGAHDIFVGIQTIGGADVQLCVGLGQEDDGLLTVVPASALAITDVAIPSTGTPGTGAIVWFAKIVNVLRIGGAWDTSSAVVMHD